jgi:hypothetical protein
MTALLLGDHTRITRDPASKAIRTWFDPSFRLPTASHDSPAVMAREVLADSAHLFAWDPTADDLVDQAVITAPGGASVRFAQTFHEVPVDASDIVVNLASGGHLHSVYNGYHYDIPADLDTKPEVDQRTAEDLAIKALRSHGDAEVSSHRLVIYRYERAHNSNGKPTGGSPARVQALAEAEISSATAAREGHFAQPGMHYLAWDVRVRTMDPKGSYRVLVDAATGHILNLIDLAQYATAEVFDPNPIVTSGNTALRHNSPLATVDGQRISVSVDRLSPPTMGVISLNGEHVRMATEEDPAVAAPANLTGDFGFAWTDNGFLDAMAYYHIDRIQEYIETTLGLTDAANYSIAVDPQGLNGIDNSHYQSLGGGQGYIAFGGGLQPIPGTNPVPDAADAMVVLHEYGHALQDNANPGFDDPVSGIGEGWGDTLAAIFFDAKHADPAATRGFMMSWDSEMGTGSWPGRRYDVTWLFDGPEYTSSGDNHTTGQLWCATMFELYRTLGGDSVYSGTKAAAVALSLRLHLMANFMVPTHTGTAQQMGQQVEAADHALNGWEYANGLHRKVIYDTFRRRHLAGYPNLAVDLFIDDGRAGGYGSTSGNDAFNEQLWQDAWWDTQDLWVRTEPYADAAAQQAGTPADHVEPAVGSPAYLYVRVGNKGTSAAGSGQITVKAFHADPGIGLTWPTDWIANTTGSHTEPNVLPGQHLVVGPFDWTPTVVGHECVLAIVENAHDRAVSQDLAATDVAYDGQMVPFDNNIAQRNLAPTPAAGGGKHRFSVRNPFDRQSLIRLVVDADLPRGWTYRLANEGRLELAPHEKRWVDLVIEREDGLVVKDFTKPRTLRITGMADDVAIGGMTYYLAPPSAFPSHHHGHGHEHGEGGGHHGEWTPGEGFDLMPLHIPWGECAIEGEIDIRVRFRKD